MSTPSGPRLVLGSLATMGFFFAMFFAVVPSIILLSAGAPIRVEPTVGRLVGAVLLLACLAWVVQLVARFVQEGLGTPAPFAPPERLVASGVYRRTRNPMYLAYLGIAIGEALLVRSWLLATYALVLFGAAHWFVTRVEEPGLERRFGDAYRSYCERVPRWWPFGSRPTD